MVFDCPDGLQIFVSRQLLVDHVHYVLRGKFQDHIEEVGEQLAEFLVVAPFEIDEGEVEVCGDELCELPEEADLVVDLFLVERFQQFLSLVRQEDC